MKEEITRSQLFRQKGIVVGVSWELKFDQVDNIVAELMHCPIDFVDIGFYQFADCILNEIHGLSVEHILSFIDEVLSWGDCLDILRNQKR